MEGEWPVEGPSELWKGSGKNKSVNDLLGITKISCQEIKFSCKEC